MYSVDIYDSVTDYATAAKLLACVKIRIMSSKTGYWYGVV